MKSPRFAIPLLAVTIVAGLAAAAYLTSAVWLPWVQNKPPAPGESPSEASSPADKIIVGDQAQKNLGLTAGQLKAQTFWKAIEAPGIVVDRVGLSEQEISAPTTSVVSAIHHVPGDIIRPGDVLFTLKLQSESLHQTQTELAKATQDIKFTEAKRNVLVASGGAVSQASITEMDNQLARLHVAVKAYTQELLNRGLTRIQVEHVSTGDYAAEIEIKVPPPYDPDSKLLTQALVKRLLPSPKTAVPTFEVQDVKIKVGQQVQAGQTLCHLVNHQALAIEGQAFPDEAPLLERSFKGGWPVEVDFLEDAATDWGESKQSFFIQYVASDYDPVNRTFAWRLPLDNQSKVVVRDGSTRLLWRYRLGQKVRLHVRVAEMKNVFVLPAAAVVRDGLEAYVFTQNVNTFERKSIHVLLQERERIVIANDGTLETYAKEKEGTPATAPKEKEMWTIPAIVQNAAAQLNRMAKAGSAGVPKGYHIHADGSLHKNEDEGK